eukprot:7262221-Alexandrium_andersonii.AAC.1
MHGAWVQIPSPVQGAYSSTAVQLMHGAWAHAPIPAQAAFSSAAALLSTVAGTAKRRIRHGGPSAQPGTPPRRVHKAWARP